MMIIPLGQDFYYNLAVIDLATSTITFYDSRYTITSEGEAKEYPVWFFARRVLRHAARRAARQAGDAAIRAARQTGHARRASTHRFARYIYYIIYFWVFYQVILWPWSVLRICDDLVKWRKFDPKACNLPLNSLRNVCLKFI